MEYSEVPQLIDFFKCEAPLCQERTQEFQSWSPSPYQLNGAIADEELEPEHPSGILVDFFKTGDGDHHYEVDADHHCGVDAAVLSRCLSAGEDKHPMAKGGGGGGESAGVVVEQWSRPGALKLVSPTSTGTEESGTAAPKTPTFEMEIAYSRPDELDSTHQGSSGFHVAESGKVLQKDHNEQQNQHGQKRLKRVIPASIAPPSIRSEPLDQTPTSCFRDVCTQIQFPAGPSRPLQQHDDEETEVLVQAATSLLSLASNGRLTPSSGRLTPSNESLLRRSMSSNENLRRWTSSHLEPDEGDERCSSVLSRPSNKRRYKLMVDLLAECPRVQRRNAIVT